MAQLVDNLIAIRILTLLVKPFIQTDAYRLGIIDAKGKNLIKPTSFTTSEQRNAYTYLHRLVFNMKKIINRLPGGESTLKSLVGALWLVKEYYESGSRTTSQMEAKYKKLMETLNNNVHLVEEEILVNKFFKEDGMGVGAVGGAPTNNTSGPVATQEPKIYPKSKKKPILGLARRSPLAVKEIK